MKTLTGNAQTEIAKLYGTEPITIIGINWQGTELFYADKDIENIKGKILEFGAIDSILTVKNSPSSAVSVRLSDIDGQIKDIIDNANIQKVPCIIYQGYENLDVVDKFIICKGEVSTPFTWSEGDRTVAFEIVTEIEGREYGFSPEEAQFDFVSDKLIGDAWPLCFGDVVHVPATKVRQTAEGQLQDYMCILDPNLIYQLNSLKRALNDEQMIQAYYMNVINSLNNITPDPGLLIILYTYVIKAIKSQKALDENIDNAIEVQKRLISNPPSIKAQKAAKDELFRLENIKANMAFQAELIARAEQEIEFLNTLISELQEELRQHRFNGIPYNRGVTTRGIELQITEFINQKAEVFNAVQNKLNDLGLPFGSSLAVLHLIKEWLEERIKFARWAYDHKMHARKEILRSIDFQRAIYASYTQIQIEICKQQNSIKDSVTILYGSSFSSGTITVSINGVNWKGSFTGNIFTFTNPGYPTAQLSSIDLTQWIAPGNECGYIDEMNGMDVFYLDDATINLKGLYVWAESVNGNRHFLKILEQDGAKCTFELKPISYLGGQQTGNNLVRSTTASLPQYSTPFGPIGFVIGDIVNPNDFNNGPIQNLDPVIISLLGGAPLTQAEWDNLATLEALYWAPMTMIVPFPTPRDIYTITGPDIDTIIEASSVVLPHWFTVDYPVPHEELPDSLFWEAEPGAVVRSADDTSEIYVANILPSTIKSVYGYRKWKEDFVLTPIPTSYYTKNEAEVLNADLTVTSLKFKRPLDQIAGEKWKDAVYVTLTSSVSSSISYILGHLIDTYTNYTVDVASFADIHIKIGTKYPANFALLTRGDIYKLLSDVAFQARCVLYLKNNVFYIKLISEEPSSSKTITESDVELESLRLTISSTDDLITKMNVTWRENYLPDSEKKLILRHNISTYGLYQQNFDFFIYTNCELVEKMATFWLIRLSNTWKHISFNTFLTNIELDALDSILLDFNTSYFASTDVKAFIESIHHDSGSQTLEIDAQLPVRAGEMEEYPFYWASDASSDEEFPTENDDGGGPYGDIEIQEVEGE